ncbi:MAG TPA: hypothetical protein VF897_20535 [Roseiflexaceae bacterium]
MTLPDLRIRRPARPGARLLLLALGLLALVACGREAPPRAAATLAPARRLLATTAPTQPPAAGADPAQPAAAGADPRALGDPNAPITVIEYGDYQ